MINGTMKAVVARSYGSPAVLAVEDIRIPRPDPGQIQVRVEAAALNGCDLDLLSGRMAEAAPLEFPHVPGSDLAGTVTEVGEGVTRFAVGDHVFGTAFPRATGRFGAAFCSPLSLTSGAMAEYAVLDADTPALAHRPPALDAERAAALPISGLTALPLLRAGQPQPGETVLVIGATGGVGSVVVPLLSAAKAHVIATAGAADEDHVRRLGADEVIDYRSADVVAEVSRRHPDGVDAVVNLALPADRLIDVSQVVRRGGRLMNATYPAPEPGTHERDDLTMDTVYSAARPGDLDELAARATGGTLPAAIGRRYSLDDGPRAYLEFVQQHTRGKLLVAMNAQA
ncbi:NADP-dependent oxidoreductase [Streptomyces angustmyceticus]|uniref:NADP-dependent oxidoreductase n=1 Tax=Streptomyces angustmyceticus TaxID=285578 RepID=UPI00344EFCB9